ncbi:carboxymuconolactone decarboxylase family protein [Flavobacterium gelatinilyticum]|uniref:carboxymuconolactone decarboxylase family protein n=1 Tax=Flavobacterium gelatinilyticum TaxID=3003260 RepID=UPI00247FBBBE|nr:carboxymuconolactone decarboxylase family protein [Flavobacterium gelatinilyticum]
MSAQNPINKSLNTQEQSIVTISALTAVGDIDHLKVEFKNGLDTGLTTNEIKEILVQLYAYCGFPRSLNGITAFMAVVEERKTKGIQDKEGREASKIDNTLDKYQSGKQNLQQLTGIEEKQLKGANAFAPAIDTFLKEHLFADIFNRDVLTFEQRELTTIAALASMSGVAPQLQAHMGMGMNTGITETQLLQALDLIEKHIGKQQADTAKEVLTKVIAVKQNK